MSNNYNKISETNKIDSVNFREIDDLKNLLPEYILTNYPKFVEFIKVYLDYNNTSDIIDNLRNNRNPDISDANSLLKLKKEYGHNIEDSGIIDNSVLLKLYKPFLESKGTPESIAAYFKIFLNSEANVLYPKDNILRVSDGVWDDINKKYLNNNGKISESSMVIQDSDFYQIFSYLIKSNLSINTWYNNFKKMVHPSGWKVFGTVVLNGIGNFYKSLNSLLVPGTQISDARIILLNTPNTFNSIIQSSINIRKTIFNNIAIFPTSLIDINKTLWDLIYNMFTSNLKINVIQNYTINQLTQQVAETITISNIGSNTAEINIL